MNSTFRYVRWAAMLAMVLPFLSGCASKGVPNSALLGHWEGQARIVMIWCQQTNLPVKLDIQTDGSVSGIAGDAKISEGRCLKNRGWLGRKLNLATDYIITGKLNGPIVAAEGINRKIVMMPFNLDGQFIKGGVATSGTCFGGKKSMILTARSLELTKGGL